MPAVETSLTFFSFVYTLLLIILWGSAATTHVPMVLWFIPDDHVIQGMIMFWLLVASNLQPRQGKFMPWIIGTFFACLVVGMFLMAFPATIGK